MEEAPARAVRQHGSIADWRARNPGWNTEERRLRRLATTRAWRARTPDWTREWRAKNPEATKARRAAAHANEKAKRHGAAGHLAASDVRSLWERHPVCVRCGEGQGLDHIVALADGGANDVANIQNLCYACNNAKEYEAKKFRPRKRGPSGAWCRSAHPSALVR